MDLWVPPPSRFALSLQDRNRPSSPRSPHKRQASTTAFHDPLLSRLSPSSTLEALQGSKTVEPSPQDAVYGSIAAASTSERALGIRAASAGKQLKEWYREIQDWDWHTSRNGFEVPDGHGDLERAQNNGELSEHTSNGHNRAQQYWGSIPARTVIEYEHRIGEIRDAMVALQLDELKMHVRDAHFSSTSIRPSSSTLGDYKNGATAFAYRHMDDFTAIVTTTIMQALPVIFRLEALMSTWEARVATLRAVPGFTNTMAQTQQEMIAAWRTIDDPDDAPAGRVSRPLVSGLKARLESQIRDLGQRLDYMLDMLEGRQDNLPDSWIDELERLEADFCDWAVEAERRMTDRELMSHVRPAIRHHDETGILANHSPTDQANCEQSDVSSSAPKLVPTPGSSAIPGGFVDEHDDRYRLGHRPMPLNLQHRPNRSNSPSDYSSDTTSYPGSATSDYFSNMSSPEIHDASKTEYFGVGSPVEVTTPGIPRSESRTSQDTVTQQCSQRTEHGDRPLPAVATPERSRASSVIPEPTIAEDTKLTAVTTDEVPAKHRHRFEE